MKVHVTFETEEQRQACEATLSAGSASSVERAYWRDTVSALSALRRADQAAMSERERCVAALEIRAQRKGTTPAARSALLGAAGEIASWPAREGWRLVSEEEKR